MDIIMITILAILTAKQGKEEALAEVCLQLAKEVSANEEGCTMYIPHISSEDAAQIIFFEKYLDQEALDDHQKTPHFLAAKKKFKELLAAPSAVKVLAEMEK
jgi:quinol monooxygenase YgiN